MAEKHNSVYMCPEGENSAPRKETPQKKNPQYLRASSTHTSRDGRLKLGLQDTSLSYSVLTELSLHYIKEPQHPIIFQQSSSHRFLRCPGYECLECSHADALRNVLYSLTKVNWPSRALLRREFFQKPLLRDNLSLGTERWKQKVALHSPSLSAFGILSPLSLC